MFAKTTRAIKCDVCTSNLKKQRRSDTFHACSPCHNEIIVMESKAKRIFGA